MMELVIFSKPTWIVQVLLEILKAMDACISLLRAALQGKYLRDDSERLGFVTFCSDAHEFIARQLCRILAVRHSHLDHTAYQAMYRAQREAMETLKVVTCTFTYLLKLNGELSCWGKALQGERYVVKFLDEVQRSGREQVVGAIGNADLAVATGDPRQAQVINRQTRDDGSADIALNDLAAERQPALQCNPVFDWAKGADSVQILRSSETLRCGYSIVSALRIAFPEKFDDLESRRTSDTLFLPTIFRRSDD